MLSVYIFYSSSLPANFVGDDKLKKINSSTVLAIYTLVVSTIFIMNVNIDMSLSEKIGTSSVVLILNFLFKNVLPLTMSNIEFLGMTRLKDLKRTVLILEAFKVLSLMLFAISLTFSILQLAYTFFTKEVTAFTFVLLMSLTLWISFHIGAKKAVQQAAKLIDSISKNEEKDKKEN